MQDFFTTQQSLIAAFVTLLVTSLLSAIVRRLPPGNWLIELLRFVFQAGYTALGDPRKNRPLLGLVFAACALSQLSACGVLKADAKSPCPGLYCIEVDGLPLPVDGDPALCFDTQPEMLRAKAQFEREGRKVEVRK